MIGIGRLTDIAPREAWRHEAQDFTPWLAEHLDELGEKVGMSLELESTEVAVEDFSADIVARNPLNDTRVLIENQLEATDHRHLGQILTYMTGLDAQAVIWIATEFREPHLSAIKWLNEHTADPYAFFAVRLRVVRIGDSPVAPVFEVLSRPNNWERQVHALADERGAVSELSRRRSEFWQGFFERHPEELEHGNRTTGGPVHWRIARPKELIISLFQAKDRVGIYIRPWSRGDSPALYQALLARADEIRERLGVEVQPALNDHYLPQTLPLDIEDRDRWPQAFDWLHEKAALYDRVLRDLLPD